MRLLFVGLAGAAEGGPDEDIRDWEASLLQLDCEAADFLDLPANEFRRDPGFVLFGAMSFAWDRTAVITA